MLAVLRQRDFSLLWFGGVLSVIGDFFLFIALPFFVYERTGSVLSTGAMFAAETLPRLLFGSVAGVFVDRWDRKRTMVLADLSRALILLPLLAVAAGGPLWLVYAVAFVEATVSQFFLPAKNALVPNLVADRHLTAANSLNSMGQDVPSLVGPLLGGALLPRAPSSPPRNRREKQPRPPNSPLRLGRVRFASGSMDCGWSGGTSVSPPSSPWSRWPW